VSASQRRLQPGAVEVLDGCCREFRLEKRADGLARWVDEPAATPPDRLAGSSILGNNLRWLRYRHEQESAARPGVCLARAAAWKSIFWESLIFARSHLWCGVVVENNDPDVLHHARRSPIDLSLVCRAGVTAGRRAPCWPMSRCHAAAAREDAAAGQPTVVEFDITAFNQHAGPTPGWPGDPTHIALEQGLLVGDDEGILWSCCSGRWESPSSIVWRRGSCRGITVADSTYIAQIVGQVNAVTARCGPIFIFGENIDSIENQRPGGGSR
jgi:hypothetical protein